MDGRQAVFVLSALVVGAVVLAPAVSAGALPGGELLAQAEDGDDGLGQEMTSFMQSSAADANSTVETELWEASVNSSEAPEKDVTKRAGTLERRLERLQAESDRLEAQREAGNISEPLYTARASRVRAEIANLRDDIDRTNRTAERFGVNVDTLDELRSNASKLTGPEVSARARNITDAPRGPPEGTPGGPPGEQNNTGPPDDSGNETGPSDVTDPGNETGPPDDTDTGPPDETGSDDESDELGPGNDTGPPGDTESDESVDESDGGDVSDGVDESDGGDVSDGVDESDGGDDSSDGPSSGSGGDGSSDGGGGSSGGGDDGSSGGGGTPGGGGPPSGGS